MRQLGLSLVELMVAIAIASFIALAATSYYAAMFSASNAVRNTASAQAHFNAVANTLVAEIRRSGYRGSPTEVAAYVATTGNSSGTPALGNYPAVETATGCALVAYARDYTCASGDDSNFTECAAGAGTATSLHYRSGLRLSAGVIEAVSVIHPNQYIGSAPVDSSCTATGGTSAWAPLSVNSELYFDDFTISECSTTIYDGDTACVVATTAAPGCSTPAVTNSCGSNVYADCGDSISCRIKRVYKVEVCAYPTATDGLCDPNYGGSVPNGQLYNEFFVTPRNDVLISKDYSS
jgi:prepilin-type N-terminal cleavage/methylation domain-containing protein